MGRTQWTNPLTLHIKEEVFTKWREGLVFPYQHPQLARLLLLGAHQPYIDCVGAER